jgi:hypothetical protein
VRVLQADGDFFRAAVRPQPRQVGALLAILGEVRPEAGDDHRRGPLAELAAEPRERELGAVHAGHGEGRRRAASRRVRHQSARRGVRGARALRHLLEVRPHLGLGGGGGILARLGHGLQTRQLGVHLGGVLHLRRAEEHARTTSDNLG